MQIVMVISPVEKSVVEKSVLYRQNKPVSALQCDREVEFEDGLVEMIK